MFSQFKRFTSTNKRSSENGEVVSSDLGKQHDTGNTHKAIDVSTTGLKNGIEDEVFCPVNPHDDENRSAKSHTITALKIRPAGILYCYGSASGVVVVHEAGKGEICRRNSNASIKHMAWSNNSELLAYINGLGQVSVQKVRKSNDHSRAWRVKDVLINFPLPVLVSTIRQIIFHATGNSLLIFTENSLINFALASTSHTEVELPLGMSEVSWIRHPVSADHVIGFGTRSIFVTRWNAFHVGMNTLPFEYPYVSEALETVVGTPIMAQDSTRILLPLVHQLTTGLKKTSYLLFGVASLNRSAVFSPKVAGSLEELPVSLEFKAIPLDISVHISVPLAISPIGTMIFLDTNQWICTWRLPIETRVARSKSRVTDTEQSSCPLKQQYLLPRDWIDNGSECMCTLLPEGIFLCSRGQKVSEIKAASLWG